jgi:hypothetical protein
MNAECDVKSYRETKQAVPLLQRQAERREYPLSLNQQLMWFQSQLDAESNLWNLGARMSISGVLDAPTLIRAIENTVDRHEILRSIFILSDDDLPVQRVIEDVPVRCPIRDVPQGLSAYDQDEHVWTQIAKLADPVYDLTKPPLFRAELLRAGEEHHYLLFAFHHLLLDAFYSGQFMKEIVVAYHTLLRGEPLPPKPALQYGDFCVWQQERWNAGLMEDTVSFWQEQLREPLPELKLADDTSVPFPRTMKSQVSFYPSAEVVNRLRAIGRETRTTLFRVVLSMLTAYLALINRSEEVILDIDFSTRPREMGHNLGFFANLLPVRLPVDRTKTFTELVRTVDSQLRNIFTHREFPVRQLTRKLRGRRDARQPLSPVVITQLGALDWSLGGLQLKGGIYVTASIHDVWIGVLEREDKVEILIGHAEELFERSGRRKWAVQTQKLLEELAGRPDTSLAEIFSSFEEKQRELGPLTGQTAEGTSQSFEEVVVSKDF